MLDVISDHRNMTFLAFARKGQELNDFLHSFVPGDAFFKDGENMKKAWIILALPYADFYGNIFL